MLLISSAVRAQKAPVAPAAARIPGVTVESLAGDPITLPDALRGKVGVLVIGFSRGSQQAVTDWAKKLAADYRESSTVVYYEMPMLASIPRWVRGLVVRQMRSSVPEHAWPRLVPLTEDEKTWRSVAHYAAEDDAYILLVDGQGIVRWQTAGSPTDTLYKELQRQLGATEGESATADRR